MTNGLGFKFDVALGNTPADAVAGAITGKRVHLANYAQAALVVICGSGSTDIADLDVQQHTAASGGTSTDLDVVTFYHLKAATTLAGTEQWTKVTQAAASEITDFGGASAQQLLVVEFDAAQLADGYEWISADFPDFGTNGSKYVASVWMLHGLRYQREPTLLPQPNA